jgi:transposase
MVKAAEHFVYHLPSVPDPDALPGKGDVVSCCRFGGRRDKVFQPYRRSPCEPQVFGREFKVEAVKLIRDRGVGVAQASRDLEVAESVLRRWMRDLASDPAQAFPGHAQVKPEHQEIGRLRREFAKLKAERDILKKAAVGSTGQRTMIDFMMFRKDLQWREPADLAYRRSRKESFGSDGRTVSLSAISGGLSASTRARFLVCCKPKAALRRRCGSGLPML